MRASGALSGWNLVVKRRNIVTQFYDPLSVSDSQNRWRGISCILLCVSEKSRGIRRL